jgi:hypothetical protein
LPPDRPAAEPSSEAAASAPQSAVGHDGSHGSNLGFSINLNQVPANTDGRRVAKAARRIRVWARITDYLRNGAATATRSP